MTVQNNFANEIGWVIGGLHLYRSSTKKIIDIIDCFNIIQVKNLAPCHCTGEKAIRLFENRFTGTLHNIGTGASLYI